MFAICMQNASYNSDSYINVNTDYDVILVIISLCSISEL